MKAIEQYFLVVLFIMLYEVVRTFESVDEMLKCGIHVETIEKEVLSCCAQSLDEILKSDHSNESY